MNWCASYPFIRYVAQMGRQSAIPRRHASADLWGNGQLLNSVVHETAARRGNVLNRSFLVSTTHKNKWQNMQYNIKTYSSYICNAENGLRLFKLLWSTLLWVHSNPTGPINYLMVCFQFRRRHKIIVIFWALQKEALMEQVAHQAVVMQFILEMASNSQQDPRGCFRQFFHKAKVRPTSD